MGLYYLGVEAAVAPVATTRNASRFKRPTLCTTSIPKDEATSSNTSFQETGQGYSSCGGDVDDVTLPLTHAHKVATLAALTRLRLACRYVYHSIFARHARNRCTR